MKKFVLLMILMFSAPAYPASDIEKQCEVNGIDYQRAVTFIASLKQNLQANDKQKVADLAEYPVMVNEATTINGQGQVKHFKVKSRAQMIKIYDNIFSAGVRNKIIQDNSEIFCNDMGAMIADGTVWFNANSKSTGYFAVNK